MLALDWRGHGASSAPAGDFGEGSRARRPCPDRRQRPQSVAPVALGHAGWIGIDLRRRLGSSVPGLVVVDRVVSEAPAALLTTLEVVRSVADRDDAVAGLLQQWQAGVPDPALAALLADMGAVSDAMWDRAAREIESSYTRFGSPLRALAGLEHPPPVLHLVPASEDAFSFERQRAYEAEHHWYHAARLPARSHFPLFEAPRHGVRDRAVRAARRRETDLPARRLKRRRPHGRT